MTPKQKKAVSIRMKKYWVERWKKQETKNTGIEGSPLFKKLTNPVDHPPHYTQHPSGVECIQITEHFNFCVGNAIKYLWRAGSKGEYLEDLKKAAWYINREIKKG